MRVHFTLQSCCLGARRHPALGPASCHSRPATRIPARACSCGFLGGVDCFCLVSVAQACPIVPKERLPGAGRAKLQRRRRRQRRTTSSLCTWCGSSRGISCWANPRSRRSITRSRLCQTPAKTAASTRPAPTPLPPLLSPVSSPSHCICDQMTHIADHVSRTSGCQGLQRKVLRHRRHTASAVTDATASCRAPAFVSAGGPNHLHVRVVEAKVHDLLPAKCFFSLATGSLQPLSTLALVN